MLHCGSLKKWTNVLKGWQVRYFVLYTDRLCYYLSQDHLTQRRGTLIIVDRDINLVMNPSQDGFDIHVSRESTDFKNYDSNSGYVTQFCLECYIITSPVNLMTIR